MLLRLTWRSSALRSGSDGLEREEQREQTVVVDRKTKRRIDLLLGKHGL